MISNHPPSRSLPAPSYPRSFVKERAQKLIEVVDLPFILVVFIALHIPLALVMYRVPMVAAGHALLVFILGLYFALRIPVESPRVMYVIGYMVGAEVLWRATDAASLLAVEQVRYVSFLLVGLVILRNRKQVLPFLPTLYIVLLLPALINYINRELVFLRFWAVSAMIGPVATTVLSIFFYKRPLDRKTLLTLALFVIAPLVGSAAIVMYNVITLQIQFGTGSSELASGYGANQVSNALAMGVTFCWLLLIQPDMKMRWRLFLVGIIGFLGVQMLFTFSRGGAWTVAIVLVATSLLLVLFSPVRTRSFFLVIVVSIIIFVLLIPWLDEFTGGAFTQRFTSTDASGREELAQSELAIWQENPIFGIGAGMARERVDEYYSRTELQTHVEYTRALAEHGLFGLAAILVLFVGAGQNFIKAENWAARVWITALLLFTFAYLGNSSYRTTVPSFMYALTWARLFSKPDEDIENPVTN